MKKDINDTSQFSMNIIRKGTESFYLKRLLQIKLMILMFILLKGILQKKL
ncbi:hypothetical protein HBA_0060 [Sodalis endosymbiont of Henestaris halophilus]|nr:hypothetical protein HBA_0060 [Sodalis endosymbiont of Henestaris halophilus]